MDVSKHIIDRFINWKFNSNGEKVTFNESCVPYSYTFGNNVCGDYIRIQTKTSLINYIISNVDNLYTFLEKLAK